MELNKSIIQQIRSIITNAQAKAIRSVDTERVLMYWQIGKVILEEEQQGKRKSRLWRILNKIIVRIFATSIWKWIFLPSIKLVSKVLSHISNCVRTADTIQLDTL